MSNDDLIAKANEEAEIQRLLADACVDEDDLEGAANAMKLVILLRNIVSALLQQEAGRACKACHGSGKLVLHGPRGSVSHEYPCSLCGSDQATTSKPSLPQDVEEWIEKNELVVAAGSEVNSVIKTSALRAFLAGKVLVPVEVIDKALTAIRNELESAYEQAFPVCCGRSGEECCGSPAPDWPEQAKATMENLGQVEKELANALTASKGE